MGRLEVELAAEMVVVGILEIELEETEEITETEIGEIVIEIETEETVIVTETGTGMRDPVHGTVEMEGELEAKMILEMQTWFLLLMTDVVEKILMIDPETEITTENLVTDQEIETETLRDLGTGTEILKDLETEIATEKRRKAARRRKGRKAEIETEKIHITKKRRKRNEKDQRNMTMMTMNMNHTEVGKSIKSLTSQVRMRKKGEGRRRKRKKKRIEAGRGRKKRGGSIGEARKKREKSPGIGESGTIRHGGILNMMIEAGTEHHKP